MQMTKPLDFQLDLAGMGRSHFGRSGLTVGRVLLVPGTVAAEAGDIVVRSNIDPKSGWPVRHIIADPSTKSGSRIQEMVEAGCRRLPARTAVLSRFAELARASKNGFENFVRRFGALRLCRHGQPPHRCCKGPYQAKVPADAYRRLAEEAEATLLAAAALHQGGNVARIDVWRLVWRAWHAPDPVPQVRSPKSPAHARAVFQEFILPAWIRRGTLGIDVTWNEVGADLALRSGSKDLMAAIARELVLAVLRGSRSERCYYCGNLFTIEAPARHRRNGVRPLCGEPKCKKEKNRQAAARHRKRS